MKKLLFLLIVIALTSCNKHFCPAYGQEKPRISYFDRLKANNELWNAKIDANEEKLKAERQSKRQSKISLLTPGDYLIKSRNQILTGVGLQILSGTVAYFTANSYAKNYDPQYLKTNPTGIYTGCIVAGLVGFGFEISGICQIGKAGISLNENGVGIKVKF